MILGPCQIGGVIIQRQEHPNDGHASKARHPKYEYALDSGFCRNDRGTDCRDEEVEVTRMTDMSPRPVTRIAKIPWIPAFAGMTSAQTAAHKWRMSP